MQLNSIFPRVSGRIVSVKLVWIRGNPGFMGYLKGKSSTMIYEQFGDLKYKYRNRSFWCKGYYVDTVGKNERRIAEYIRHQLDEDKLGEQLSIPETEKYRKKRK